MRQYHDLLTAILADGNDRGSRAGGTRSLFGYQFRHDLSGGFPLLTTKKVPWKAIVVELLWFLRGDTNIKYLLENGVHIWTDDAYRVYKNRYETEAKQRRDMGEFVAEICSKADFERAIRAGGLFSDVNGDLGPIYGKQWRRWYGGVDMPGGGESPVRVDQIKQVIESIRKNPEGRRHIVTAWNPAEIHLMALPACHCMFQFYVHNSKLSCHMYQRSADVFLGVPFNIASYALLTHIIAHQCGLGVGDLIISFGDVHIYNNHMDAVKEQLGRSPRDLPLLLIVPSPREDVRDYLIDDFQLEGYDPYPAIKGDLSVGT